jgi:hypothetical protein
MQLAELGGTDLDGGDATGERTAGRRVRERESSVFNFAPMLIFWSNDIQEPLALPSTGPFHVSCSILLKKLKPKKEDKNAGSGTKET